MAEYNNTPEIQDLMKEMNYLFEISQRISEIKSPELLLNEIIESCKEVLKAEASSLLIYDEKENELYFEIATGEKGGEVIKKSFKVGEGIAGWVAEQRVPLLIEDCYEDPRFNKEFDIKSNFRTKSMICVPMLRKDN
ncbi:MAG: GAF domain-containing protein, partial [Ignavibacteria bacterium]|nr:GAF domain-containing protein [Ignavibacteria bacterium]